MQILSLLGIVIILVGGLGIAVSAFPWLKTRRVNLRRFYLSVTVILVGLFFVGLPMVLKGNALGWVGSFAPIFATLTFLEARKH